MKPGQLIASRYTIEKEIGRGGMGSVFIATDQKFGGKVALKVATAAGVTLDEFRERFAREARIGHRLGRSEGFVRALDWGEIDGTTLYLSMDLVENARPLDLTGGTLAGRLERLARAASLVATAHGLGVVHRDLKPQNFLVDGAGRIFLSDFGLAKSRGEADATGPQITRTGLGMGTPNYMPPEQFDDARGTDERADVYALGVMLFQVLTGKLPYEGSATSIMQKQVRVQGGLDRPPRPSLVEKNVPAALDDLCARALELDRDRRLADARSFAAALSPPPREAGVPHPNPPPAPRGEGVSASRGESAAAPPPSSHVRPVKPPPAKSNTKVVAIIGCVAIVGMALLSCVLIAIFKIGRASC